jgi:hypothetical protein
MLIVIAAMEAQFIFDERTDFFIARYGIEPYIFPRLDELKIDGVAFVTEFWRQHNRENDMNMEFIRYGFKYNDVFNERLGRALDHPTWRQFIIDCLQYPMEKQKLDLDGAMFAREHPGMPLPPELRCESGQSGKGS